ncbi:MAG: hypothetical protein JXR26_06355 [Balneolaceae bacterium]|nr:hypothetical protein [Balneolaceae bacterium]
MGRAMLIICAGVLVALGYTFIGSANQSEVMTERNVNTYYAMKAQSTAYTGIQFAIQRYNDDASNNHNDYTEEFNYTETTEDANLTLSVKESTEIINGVNTEVAKITSKSIYPVGSSQSVEHTVIATFDISESQVLVPEFMSALSIATENFTFDINGSSAQINGHNSACSNSKPGVAVTSENAKSAVGEYTAITGTSGNQADVDPNLSFQEAEELISMLEDQPEVNYLTGDQQVKEMGTAQNPGIFFIEENVKLAGGISEGFGIMVVRSNADFDYEGGLDVNGNFTFNGLVIFQNATEFSAAGTPNINGSVLIGNSEGYTTTISIKGDVTVQYDCSAKDYADWAVKNALNTTIYKQLSVYE